MYILIPGFPYNYLGGPVKIGNLLSVNLKTKNYLVIIGQIT